MLPRRNTSASRHCVHYECPRIFLSALLLLFHGAVCGSPPVITPGSLDELAILGGLLFSDPRLSNARDVSCATCHDAARAFTDGEAVSAGTRGRRGTRNAPSLLNIARSSSFGWDGRRTKLNEQVLAPFTNPVEHGLANTAELLRRIQANKSYADGFARVFGARGKNLTLEQVGSALAAHLNTLSRSGTSLDRYLYRGDRSALSPAAMRGLEIFRGPAGCAACHTIESKSAPLTDGKFHHSGVGIEAVADRLPELTGRVLKMDPSALDRAILADHGVAALGRFVVTRDPKDIGKFKTPSLHNVADTAPYMHDGSIATLAGAVEHEIYYQGLTMGRPLSVSLEERNALVEFLQSLKSDEAKAEVPFSLP